MLLMFLSAFAPRSHERDAIFPGFVTGAGDHLQCEKELERLS
jgi:hypothetical protein